MTRRQAEKVCDGHYNSDVEDCNKGQSCPCAERLEALQEPGSFARFLWRLLGVSDPKAFADSMVQENEAVKAGQPL